MEPNTNQSNQSNTTSQTNQKPNSLKGLLDSCTNSKKGHYKNTKGKTGPTKPSFDNEGKKVEGNKTIETKNSSSNYNSYNSYNSSSSNYNSINTNNTNSYTQFKGLKNFGNVCYSNSVLQCLTNCRDFFSVLENLNSKIENIEDADTEFPILFNLHKFMMFYKSKNTSQASENMKEIINIFDPQRLQNDVHEFLIFVLDRLNEEAAKVKSKIDKVNTNKEVEEWEEVKKGGKRMKQTNNISNFQTSSISEVFQGVLKHEIEEKGKSVSNCNVEPFFVISLDINEDSDSLQKCLTNYFSKRNIELGNSKSSNISNIVYQKSYIDKIPKVLIFQLKTFYYDPINKKIKKINKSISFDEKLVLDDSFLSPGIVSKSKDLSFEIIAVICHKGTKADEGHYICFCKDDKQLWWSLDDLTILRVDKKTIFSYRPYMLFYQTNL